MSIGICIYVYYAELVPTREHAMQHRANSCTPKTSAVSSSIIRFHDIVLEFIVAMTAAVTVLFNYNIAIDVRVRRFRKAHTVRKIVTHQNGRRNTKTTSNTRYFNPDALATKKKK